MTPGWRPLAGAALLALVAGLPPGPGADARAQAVAAPSLKAAFLLNFARFAEWPDGGTASPDTVALCAAGDELVAAALAGTARNQSIGERRVTVLRVDTVAETRRCDVLYVDGGPDRAAEWLDAARGRPVLTVTDRDRLPGMDSIVRLFVERDRMKFEIDVESAREAGLRLSARLLALASRGEP